MRVRLARFAFIPLSLVLLLSSCGEPSGGGQSGTVVNATTDGKVAAIAADVAEPSSSSGLSQTRVAKVTAIVGRAWSLTAGARAALAPDQVLAQGQVIEAGSASRVTIEISGVGAFVLKGKGSLSLDAIGDGAPIAMRLDGGSVASAVKHFKSPDSVTIRCGSACCAVRGTRFLVEDKGAEGVLVAVSQGRVALYPSAYPGSGLYSERSSLPPDSFPTLDTGKQVTIAVKDGEKANNALASGGSERGIAGDFAKALRSERLSAEAARDLARTNLPEVDPETGDIEAAAPSASASSLPATPSTLASEAAGNAPIGNTPIVKGWPFASPFLSSPVGKDEGESAGREDDWIHSDYQGAESSADFADGWLRIDVKKGGTEAWHVQMDTRKTYSLRKGRYYLVDFVGKASVPLMVYVNLGAKQRDLLGTGDPFYSYCVTTPIKLDAKPKRYRFGFLMPVDDDGAWLRVFAGAQVGELSLRDIKVTEVRGRRWNPAQNAVGNGDFSLGFTDWDFYPYDIASLCTVSGGEMRYSPGTGAKKGVFYAHSLFPLKKGLRYRISLEASGGAGDSIVPYLCEPSLDEDLDGNKFTLISTWTDLKLSGKRSRYVLEFTPTADYNLAQFCCSVDGVASFLVIDNIVVAPAARDRP
jgi:hypothetical protein